MSDPLDLLGRTAELVNVASESFAEGPIVDLIEAELRSRPQLVVTRVGDNLVARTELGRDQRVMLAGHTDTVPANGNAVARVRDDVLWGVGSTDMKGGLAIMLASAEHHTEPAVDVTYVFYAREEVSSEHSGLEELFLAVPDLLAADVAFLGEPTDGAVEAGCQGSIRMRVEFTGARAHLARAWMGRNAIHRLAPLLSAVAAHEPRRPVIAGCRFHEALQVVAVDGGVSGNVVPDVASVVVAHRFAPDRDGAAAELWLREFLAPYLEPDDTVELLDLANSAWPAVDHPLVAALVQRHGLAVTGKLGWTDVARCAARGIPAVNLGPGDATVAHTAGECLRRDSLERTWTVVDDLLRSGCR
jgi:succinyl-diaminopimelate desuccinylase